MSEHEEATKPAPQTPAKPTRRFDGGPKGQSNKPRGAGSGRPKLAGPAAAKPPPKTADAEAGESVIAITLWAARRLHDAGVDIVKAVEGADPAISHDAYHDQFEADAESAKRAIDLVRWDVEKISPLPASLNEAVLHLNQGFMDYKAAFGRGHGYTPFNGQVKEIEESLKRVNARVNLSQNRSLPVSEQDANQLLQAAIRETLEAATASARDLEQHVGGTSARELSHRVVHQTSDLRELLAKAGPPRPMAGVRELLAALDDALKATERNSLLLGILKAGLANTRQPIEKYR